VKSLGLHWKLVEDEFRFYDVMKVNTSKTTKRIILSDLNKVFNPLGFLVPVLIKGKIFIQQIWQLKLDWDCTLPEDIQLRWDNFYTELEDLRLVTVPRCTSVIARRHKEQMSVCVRYTKNVEVFERFIGFLNVSEKQDSESLSNAINNFLKFCKFDQVPILDGHMMEPM